jgi:predicted TIM-barrel fold metal-dependent hydrolase
LDTSVWSFDRQETEVTNVIDTDTHYWEPLSAWSDYIDPKFRDRSPAFHHDGNRLLVQVGESLYPSMPNHPGLAKVYGADESLHEQTRLDKRLSTDPALRLSEMDANDTRVHIIYPTLGMVGFNSVQDPELAAALARAYNRYCRDFAAADPKRLKPTMLLPFNHPEIAVQEMTYAREVGLDVAFANPTPPEEIPWCKPRYDQIWSAMEDLDVTLAWHESAVGAVDNSVGIHRYFGEGAMAYLCAHTVEPQLAVMDMILGGALNRHPKLRMGLLEAHVSWIPGWLQLLDYKANAYGQPRGGPLTLPPSDYFRRQVFVAVFADDVGIAEAASYLGPEHANLVFSSDWPHKSLDDFDSSPKALEHRSDLSADLKAQILVTNAARWMNV